MLKIPSFNYIVYFVIMPIMISTEKCCFDNWENFPNSNLCVSQNNSGFSRSLFLHNPPLYMSKSPKKFLHKNCFSTVIKSVFSHVKSYRIIFTYFFTRKSQRKLYFVPIAGIFLRFLTFATLNLNNI